MAITEVVVNYTARNYFNDYDETRSERMTWIEPQKVSKAIDKLVRRYRNSKECDCMRKDDSDIALLTLLIAASPNPRSCADKKPSHGAACEGCEHLWWEHDMGKSIPHCKLGMEMTTTCEGFKANSLYVSYIERFGKEQ